MPVIYCKEGGGIVPVMPEAILVGFLGMVGITAALTEAGVADGEVSHFGFECFSGVGVEMVMI